LAMPPFISIVHVLYKISRCRSTEFSAIFAFETITLQENARGAEESAEDKRITNEH